MQAAPHKKFLVVPADLDKEPYEVLPTGDTLSQLYEALGCRDVEVIKVTSEIDMWIDGEGMIKSSTPTINVRVSNAIGQSIAGNCLFAGSTPSGDTIGLDADERAFVRSSIRDPRAFEVITFDEVG